MEFAILTAARSGEVRGATWAEIDLQALHAKRLTLFGVSNKLRGPAEVAEGVRGFARDVLPAFAGGHLKPVIDKVLPLEQAALAELPKIKEQLQKLDYRLFADVAKP